MQKLKIRDARGTSLITTAITVVLTILTVVMGTQLLTLSFKSYTVATRQSKDAIRIESTVFTLREDISTAIEVTVSDTGHRMEILSSENYITEYIFSEDNVLLRNGEKCVTALTKKSGFSSEGGKIIVFITSVTNENRMQELTFYCRNLT